MTTSQIAREKFEGTKPFHHKIILWTLQKYGPATNYGIARNAYYTGKDTMGRDRTFKLSYYQVNKRTSELLNAGKIKKQGTKIDDDGRERNVYILV